MILDAAARSRSRDKSVENEVWSLLKKKSYRQRRTARLVLCLVEGGRRFFPCAAQLAPPFASCFFAARAASPLASLPMITATPAETIEWNLCWRRCLRGPRAGASAFSAPAHVGMRNGGMDKWVRDCRLCDSLPLLVASERLHDERERLDLSWKVDLSLLLLR
jgi:hypothetical protein